jgi:hypothetical protein
MKAERLNILVHPVFIISLFLLLLNDNYLKPEYHNILTGKLSDATGLILLSLLLTVFIGRKMWIALFCAAFFTWWKSSLSTTAINFANEFLKDKLHRTIDYTDLFTLPLVLVVNVVRPRQLNVTRTFKKLGALASACICLFAFCRTSSMRYPHYNIRDNEVRINKSFNSKMSETEVLDKLRRLNITVYKDSIRFYPLRKNELYFRDSMSNMTQLHWGGSSFDSGLYERRAEIFYVIPEYIINGEKINNIEFYISPRNGSDQKTTVIVESFQTKRAGFEYSMKDSKETDAVKKAFRKLFKE